MPTLQQLFRRKPVPEMSEETGADTGSSELARTIGLFQMSMYGVGAATPGFSQPCTRPAFTGYAGTAINGRVVIRIVRSCGGVPSRSRLG